LKTEGFAYLTGGSNLLRQVHLAEAARHSIPWKSDLLLQAIHLLDLSTLSESTVRYVYKSKIVHLAEAARHNIPRKSDPLLQAIHLLDLSTLSESTVRYVYK
jgi:hypothetical protein